MIEKGLDRKTLKKNMTFAFLAQGVAMLLSILMTLLVPKVLNVTEYSYWQLFLFYVSYAGLFHFGLNDGIYLRFGGSAYQDVDHALFGTELKIWTLFQMLIGLLIALIGIFCLRDVNRTFVIIAFAAFMVLFNGAYFIGYVFQAVNRTRIFSIADMINKGSFIFCVIGLILYGTYSFRTFIYFYFACLCLSCIYYLYQGRAIVFSAFVGWKTGLAEIKKNVSVGIKLLIANLASILILGIGRIVIDSLWGIQSFGKISFSLTLTNFFLVFIAQVSMVLFPALRQTNPAFRERYYKEIDSILNMLLPLILVFYIPIKKALVLWLPQYAVSLDYLAILLPLCLFDGKMQLLCVTYFKVLRKEKALLYVNLFACFLSLILSLLGGFLFHSINCIVFSMLISVIFRYVLSALYLSKLMAHTQLTSIVAEILLSAIFIGVSLLVPSLGAFVIVLMLYLLYLYLFRTEAKSVFRRLLKR